MCGCVAGSAHCNKKSMFHKHFVIALGFRAADTYYYVLGREGWCWCRRRGGEQLPGWSKPVSILHSWPIQTNINSINLSYKSCNYVTGPPPASWPTTTTTPLSTHKRQYNFSPDPIYQVPFYNSYPLPESKKISDPSTNKKGIQVAQETVTGHL